MADGNKACGPGAQLADMAKSALGEYRKNHNPEKKVVSFKEVSPIVKENEDGEPVVVGMKKSSTSAVIGGDMKPSNSNKTPDNKKFSNMFLAED